MRRRPARFLLALAVLPFALPGAKGDTRPATPGVGDEWVPLRAGIPDYREGGTGLTFSGVTPASPAEKGGIRAGDVLVKFGPRQVRNIYDYTYAIGAHEPGDAVTVLVKRDGVEVSLDLVLAARPSAAR